MYDLIGGRATWTALGMPTEGQVGDRRRIAHHLRPARVVPVDAVVGDAPPSQGRMHGLPDPLAVVDGAGVLLGSIDGVGAARLPASTPVRRAMTPAPGTIRPELRVEEVAERLQSDGLDHVFVTTVGGVLLGIVHREGLHV